MSWIVAVVDGCARRAWLVVAGFMLLAALSVLYAGHHLSIDTDTDDLFAKNLPWRQAQIAENKNFPQFNKLIVAVVRAQAPEEAVETATALNAALNGDKTNFYDSAYPGGSNFYATEGLLLLPQTQLAKLLNSIISAQPFLGGLAADPSARGLFNGIGLIAQGVQQGQANLTPYDKALSGVAANLRAAAQGHPAPLSWQALISGDIGGDAEFVLAHPKLNQGSLQPGGVATAALVKIAAQLPWVKAGLASVDYTGQIPLSDEQFASLTQGLVVGSLVSVLLIALWLFLALRSWRLIVPILLTLVLGLVLTIGFAAAAVRVMNLISVAFAILFIGLAVDFAIQFCVRLRDERLAEPVLAAAIARTARDAGGQIALAATATACGFLAFSPTKFVGVAELGEIAGAGMFIAFFCTITFLPALLAIFAPRGEVGRVMLPAAPAVDGFLHRRHNGVLGLFAVLAVVGVYSAVTIGFDANPLDTKDPNTESMRTLNKLLDNPATNPFYADALAPDMQAAGVLAGTLQALPQVVGVISGLTFVPPDQTVKLAMLAQADNILAPTLAPQSGTAPVTAAAIRASMVTTRQQILAVKGKLPAGSAVLAIAGALGQLIGESDARVLAMNGAVTRFLPLELQRLNASLSATPITLATLPMDVKRDWFLADGRVRVEALPTPAAQTTRGLKVFAMAVLGVAPDAGGPAISTIATAGTILGSFREAAILATIAIAVILFVVFRNFRDSGLVLATLTMSALLTSLFAKIAGVQINYANIIALPLLLGVGVSFNVYFVMNYRAGVRAFLSSATALAVLFSALTTATAFGSLAASHDRGTSSMGELLLLSLLAVLISTFVFLPALLYRLIDAGKAEH